MKFILNPKNFNDWKNLHKLLVDCFAYMDEVIDPPSSLHKMTTGGLRDKANKQCLLVVYDVENLIGCAFFDTRQDVIYVGKVAVGHSHQGRGIAKKIFDIAEKFARENHKNWLELETRIELTNNHKAFGKMGFVTTAKNNHKGYDRPTSITMRRLVKITAA